MVEASFLVKAVLTAPEVDTTLVMQMTALEDLSLVASVLVLSSLHGTLHWSRMRADGGAAAGTGS